MGGRSKDFLKMKAVNGWTLLWILGSLISVIMIWGMAVSDLSTGPGVSSMIGLSARCAVPWVYLAFAASSLHILFSSDFSAWVLRNRKYFGLTFGVAMAWQALFIVWMVGVHTGYYTEEVYLLRDVIEGVVGYVFLVLMVITSFKPGRRALSRKQWRVLHKSGIYFLWAYAFSVYWWAIFYSESESAIDFHFVWARFHSVGSSCRGLAQRADEGGEERPFLVGREPPLAWVGGSHHRSRGADGRLWLFLVRPLGALGLRLYADPDP